MKKKDFSEFKNKPTAELKAKISELKETLWNLKKDLAAGKLKNIAQIHTAKKSIAQILTVLNKKPIPNS